MLKSFTTIALLLLFSMVSFAQQPLQLLLEQRGEIVVSISSSELYRIPNIQSWSVEPQKGGNALVYLNKKQYKVLQDLNIPFLPEAIPSLQGEVVMAATVREASEWNSYPDYETYLSMMQQFADNFPELCLVDTIGTTVEDRLLLTLKISDNVLSDESEPEVFYTSSMHGDELTGYVLMLRLADYLLNNYNQPEIANLVNNLEIYINPLANPDGTFAAGNNTVSGATRYNANYVDLNRNYPDPKGGSHPDGEAWQPENIAMMAFMNERHFVLSMNFHGGVEVLNYPWDTFSRRHADDAWFIYVSREYADTAHVVNSSYMDDYENGITNGYDWYEVEGGRQDYMTYFLHGREITAEISTTKLVNASTLPNYWNYNFRSLLNYLEQATYGIHGKITDADGNPLKAKISIENYDKDSSFVRTQPDGTFYRYLKGGDYSLTFESDSFLTQTVSVRVKDNQKSELWVELQKPVNIEEAVDLSLNIFPNPVTGFLQMDVSDLEFKEGNVIILNSLGKIVLENEISNNSLQHVKIDVRELKPGIYFIGLGYGASKLQKFIKL